MSDQPSDAVSSKLASALTGPILAGHLTNILLYGFLLSTFLNFSKTPAWRSMSRLHRTVLLLVLALDTVEVGFGVNDILYFGTNVSPSFAVFAQGTLPECYEPLITALIAALCQLVLALRALKITESVYIRYACIVVFGSIVLLETLWAIFLTYFSVAYHDGNYNAAIGKLGLTQALYLWMWFAAGADSIITASYITIIIRKMKGQSDTARSITKLIIKGAIQSASYTAILALATAISTQVTANGGPMVYIIPYAFWLPLSSLYALSLFATFTIGDRVTEKIRNEHSVSLQRDSKFAPESSVGVTSTNGNGHSSANPMLGLRQPSMFGSTVSVDHHA
ncbi:hypothetical protein T439DRAFT_323281 [Meredithblackwellia eburnea MCA 4105]